MNRIEELRALNPQLPIYSVCDPEFLRYGRVIDEDTAEMCEMVVKTAEMPEKGVRYVPALESIDTMDKGEQLLYDLQDCPPDIPFQVCFVQMILGVLQISPALVTECNNILKRSNSPKRYTLKDRFNVEKSKEMFVLIQSYYNPKNNVEKAIRMWNGGIGYSVKRTQRYYEKVMRLMD